MKVSLEENRAPGRLRSLWGDRTGVGGSHSPGCSQPASSSFQSCIRLFNQHLPNIYYFPRVARNAEPMTSRPGQVIRRARSSFSPTASSKRPPS